MAGHIRKARVRNFRVLYLLCEKPSVTFQATLVLPGCALFRGVCVCVCVCECVCVCVCVCCVWDCTQKTVRDHFYGRCQQRASSYKFLFFHTKWWLMSWKKAQNKENLPCFSHSTLKKNNLFIIFGCAGSPLLCGFFLRLRQVGPLYSFRAWASHCRGSAPWARGFSGARAPSSRLPGSRAQAQ